MTITAEPNGRQPNGTTSVTGKIFGQFGGNAGAGVRALYYDENQTNRRVHGAIIGGRQ